MLKQFGLVLPLVVGAATLAMPGDVAIQGVENSGRAEFVALTATASDVLMGGWRLQSVRGAQCYVFPDMIAPAEFRVHSGSSVVDSPPTDLLWTTRNVWNNKGDHAILRDASGNVISEYIYGNYREAREQSSSRRGNC